MPATDAAPSDSGPGIVDSGPEPDPCAPQCDFDESIVGPVSYLADVEPIFTNNCSDGFCHTGSMGGTTLLTAGNVCATTVGVPSKGTANTTMMPRIVPGDPEGSYLWHKVRGTYACAPALGGGARMPFGEPCLFPAEMGVIRAWIAGGAACE